MENFGVGLSQLLVAPDVQIYWQVHLYLWHVSPYQGTPSTTSRQAPSITGSGCSVGCCQCGLPNCITKGKWQGLHHGSGWLHYKMLKTVTTISTIGSARLNVKHVWRHHGLPRKMLLDQGPQFVAEFMEELYYLLRIKLTATTAHHLQGDRQMEWVNQELEQYLCIFINQQQDNWDKLLSVEF